MQETKSWAKEEQLGLSTWQETSDEVSIVVGMIVRILISLQIENIKDVFFFFSF
jgi:hypothetical protein